MSRPSPDEDLILQIFGGCSARSGDARQATPCIEPAALVGLLQSDQNAEYLSPPALPGTRGLILTPSEPAACVLYVTLRRALSTGNYGEAVRLLSGRSLTGSGTPCSQLLMLEAARLYWFVDDFDAALRTLAQIDPQSVPFAHLRARDIVGSSLVELFCLKSLGYPLSHSSSAHVPRTAALRRVASDLSSVSRDARILGDAEASTWASLNAHLALGIANGSLIMSTVLDLIGDVPRNGHPHALRRAGLSFAHLREFKVAVGLLRDAHRLAEDLFPTNLVTLKSGLNLAWVTFLQTNDPRRRALAENVLRSVACRFVVTHAALGHTAVADAVNSVCLKCLGVSSDDTVLSPGEDEIGQMLERIPHDVMETIAKSLVEHAIGPAKFLPVNAPWLDLEAFCENADDPRSFGIQVKSGQTTIKMKDIPGTHVLRPHRGFIAIAVKRMGSTAALNMKKLDDEGIATLDWTGSNLVNVIRRYPSVVKLLYRKSLD